MSKEPKDSKQYFIGIDPGQDKNGLALVDDSGRLVEKKIVNSEEFKAYLDELCHKYTIKEIVLGNGTRSQRVELMIKDIDLSLELKLIDERGTTERAERLYFKEHPPRGIKKLLSLFVSWRPSQPVDDYAAYLLVRKYLNRRG
jgi:RNase H-fold protein (predicted Holliday junction resolvase)